MNDFIKPSMEKQQQLEEFLLANAITDTEVVDDADIISSDTQISPSDYVNNDSDIEDLAREEVELPQNSSTSQEEKIMAQKDYNNTVSPEDVKRALDSQSIEPKLEPESKTIQQNVADANKTISDYSTTKEGFQRRKESFKEQKTNKQAESQVIYRENQIEGENGKPIQYTNAIMGFDDTKFEFDFESDTVQSHIENLELLQEIYTNMVRKKVGGFDNITSINVKDGHLIFNKSVSITLLLKDFDKFQNNLPLETSNYIKNGYNAYLFDWSCLLACRNIRRLSFDELEFVEDIVGPANNMSYIKSDYFFRYLRNLRFLKLGDYEYDLNKPQTEDEEREKRRKAIAQARESSFLGRAKNYYQKSTFDYGRLKPTTWTDKLDNHFHMTFKDYLKNRGKKGLIRYTGGVIVRGLLAMTSTLLNAGTHFVGDSVGYLSQYRPRIATDEETGIRYGYWAYKPNERTISDAPKRTSGDEYLENKNGSSSRSKFQESGTETKKPKKKTTSKNEEMIIEDEDA